MTDVTLRVKADAKPGATGHVDIAPLIDGDAKSQVPDSLPFEIVKGEPQHGAHHLKGVHVLSRSDFAEDPVLVPMLVDLKKALAEGKAMTIQQHLATAVGANSKDGAPAPMVTQFKFEPSDPDAQGKQVLNHSTYVAIQGRNPVRPQELQTAETSGPALTNDPPDNAIFKPEDGEHISQAAVFDTLMGVAKGKLSLGDVADWAGRFGMVYRVEPEIVRKAGSLVPGFNVLVLNDAGKTEQLKVSLPVNQ